MENARWKWCGGIPGFSGFEHLRTGGSAGTLRYVTATVYTGPVSVKFDFGEEFILTDFCSNRVKEIEFNRLKPKGEVWNHLCGIFIFWGTPIPRHRVSAAGPNIPFWTFRDPFVLHAGGWYPVYHTCACLWPGPGSI